ncbi:MAG: acyl-CoA dehydratase activase [Oscillospiraceae bacterium]|nr:acyl-CoA dehydratase activase [Oscillospiraceae bacterium]
MGYKVGIDVGSTTLKTVVLDDDGNIIEKSYARHYSKAREMALGHIKSLDKLLRGHPLSVAVTGSAGLGIAKTGGIDFVQEVFATAGAVRRTLPRTDVVIELGGEDAKILFLKGTPEERMNGTCAGGTGAFIDQMAMLMDVSLQELDELSGGCERVYPIASRCGVFAKSDIQPLLNQGARKEDIAASIFQAVVDQTVTGLAQGREICGNVLFLGGPLSFMKGLQRRFTQTLALGEENAVFPSLAPYYMALGAAYYAEGASAPVTYEQLVCRLEAIAGELPEVNRRAPLFNCDAEYAEFARRHARSDVREIDISSYRGRAYLGIDCGSTTTKLALIGETGELLYRHYISNGGNPLPIVRGQIEKIYNLCGENITVAGSAATGYGEELMQSAFGIDYGIVETAAHFIAAKSFSPEVDFIIDIGGQDIKCFHIKNGAVDSVVLNEACSSGCGSFIESFAGALGYTPEQFAGLAVRSYAPVDLGSRCTVFMNSSVKQAQKDGAAVEDIAAGLAVSVVKNALYKVIRARNADELGRSIVVQGGTFCSDAVLRAFEAELGREVVRPGISELMGAYGAALYARDKAVGSAEHNGSRREMARGAGRRFAAKAPKALWAGEARQPAPRDCRKRRLKKAARQKKALTSLITYEKVKSFTHISTAAVCRKCANNCSLTVTGFPGGRKFITGNRCELGAGGPVKNTLPNLMRYKYKKLINSTQYTGSIKIGLPPVLNMYENLPFWARFFSALGCEPVISAGSSRKLYMKGQHTIPSDTVCYPAKLVHGHILDLLEKKVDFIFYPSMTYSFDEGISDNCYNCPVVAYYPEVIKNNMPGINKDNFICPQISLNSRKIFVKKIYSVLKGKIPQISLCKVKKAADAAYKAYGAYRKDIIEEGERALAYAEEYDLPVAVVAGRPYHIDPEINHGVDTLLTSLGFVVLTEDSIFPGEKAIRNVLNQWSYHARMYAAAQFAAGRADTQLVQLVSFGCGIDAVTSDEISDILRQGGKLYTQLKIDEINNLGAAKIRLRSLVAALRAGIRF